ncbi:TetR/AcrR family transcriptional regulator [Longispora urticae]
MTRTTRLSAEDWAQAALRAIGEGGLAAVAVEPLAARLGTTKGSFYWHFANREALIDAALARWENRHTEALIAGLEAEPDPAIRLRRLLDTVITTAAEDRIGTNLLATAEHPAVGPVLRRVTERRIGYVSQLFAELGFPAAEARRRGRMGVALYLGHLQLGRTTPDGPPDRRYLDMIYGLLIAGPGADD